LATQTRRAGPNGRGQEEEMPTHWDTKDRINHHLSLPAIIVCVVAVALAIILLNATIADGQRAAETRDTGDQIESVTENTAGSEQDQEVESVTMAIDLEEGGTIDFEADAGEVVIDTWEGDEVLLVVKKLRRNGAAAKTRQARDPVNIQVTRVGKDVRIESIGGSDDANSDFDVVYRFVLPKRLTKDRPADKYDMARLTSVLWRKVGKEALKWIVR
jgi:hypothetical protein